MAAWLAHGAAPPYSDRDDGTYEHLAKFYNDVYGDTATGDSFNFNQPVISSLTASKICVGAVVMCRTWPCAGVAKCATLIVAWRAAPCSRGTALVARWSMICLPRRESPTLRANVAGSVTASVRRQPFAICTSGAWAVCHRSLTRERVRGHSLSLRLSLSVRRALTIFGYAFVLSLGKV